jgi:hypothetical protein
MISRSTHLFYLVTTQDLEKAEKLHR